LFEGDAEWRKIYDKVTTTGEAKVGDRDTWVVELKPIGSDKPQINYYDKESKLLLRMTMTALTPMGEIEVSSDVLDYRDVDGVKMPFETRQSMLGQTQTMRLTKITHDAVIEDSEFAKK
jgi:outer membrane lipoprotein-sorting protein